MKAMIIFHTLFLLMTATGCSPDEDNEQADPGNIIVLMYHRIVNGPATNLYERSASDLENDLKFLKANSINVITFNDLEEVLSEGHMPAGNSAILTFDDGDQSHYSIVKPMLLKYNMKATFFLWTYMVDHDSFVNWTEVEEMSNYITGAGERPFTFGSHTFSHQYLLQSRTGFDTAVEYNGFLDYELSVSKSMIEAHTPVDVNILSLPYGDGAGDPDIITAAQRNGYKFIRTSKWEAITDPDINLFEIPSLPVLDDTTTDLIWSYLNQ